MPILIVPETSPNWKDKPYRLERHFIDGEGYDCIAELDHAATADEAATMQAEYADLELSGALEP